MTEHTSSYYAASANKYAPFATRWNESISTAMFACGRRRLYRAFLRAASGGNALYDVVLLEASRIGFGASGRKF
ncbi:hypothetical protein MJ524_10745 [Escherichia coli]|nr:hypothetical protein MJ524_10745 [Escherichia coli]